MYYMASGSFSSLFLALCSSSDVPVYLTSELVWFRFMFTPFRYSFASLIDQQLSRKATLMFLDVLSLELFQQIYLFLFYFHLNQLGNFSRQNLTVRKKAYSLLLESLELH